jgi:hypothetical protein
MAAPGDDAPVNEAVLGLAGVVAGLVVGNTGKYFGQRRNAWREARGAGLIVLADVRALHAAPAGRRLAGARRLAASWDANRQVLATFRRGTYPNGLMAYEWVRLADAFARLAACLPPAAADWWEDAQPHLHTIEDILSDFMYDPAVVWHNIRALVWRPLPRQRRGPTIPRSDPPARKRPRSPAT